MKSPLFYAAVLSAALPLIGLAWLSISNSFGFTALCESVAVAEMRVFDLRLMDGGDLNAFEREMYSRLWNHKFESYGNREIASRAKRLGGRIKIFYALAFLYMAAVIVGAVLMS